MDNYKTIYKINEYTAIEKKSKFIGTAFPVQSRDTAEQEIKALQKKYGDATHNVFAYRVLEGGQVLERQSDDGEPSGTAGMPILEVLRGEELYNIGVVVTRYYGGTLLGTGGLTRAYGHTAKGALGEIIEKKPYRQYSIVVSYNQMGQIQHEILGGDYILKDTIYTDTVEFLVYAHEDLSRGLEKKITDITSGTAKIAVTEKLIGAWNLRDGEWF